MVTGDDESNTNPPIPSTTPTAAASEPPKSVTSETAAKPPTPTPTGATESDSRSKIEPDENPTYFFGEESLVEPIFKDLVPGKIQLTEEQLAEQKRNLEEYAELLRKDRLRTEREAARLFGWVKYAETMNGRFAMFFFVTGLLTEYWTDYTIPEQVELLLRTLGVI